MTQQSVIHATAIVEKSYPKSVDLVFAAFAEPAKKRRWYADRSGNTVETFEMDFRPGGSETLAYRLGPNAPFPGALIANREIFQDIVPNQRIVLTYAMYLDKTRISVSLGTTEFKPAGQGTRLVYTEQAVYLDGHDDAGAREHGTRALFDNLEASLKKPT